MRKSGMVLFPNAKINLGLNIVAKRIDGFHDIETCFFPIGLCDILEFVKTDEETVFQSSGLSIPGNPADNLCLIAWKLLAKDFNIPSVKIHLHKQIPIGAGLGGGSSDAAYMLKGLNNYFNLKLPVDTLKYYASKLGSDCTFFIENKPSFAVGKGEILNPISLNLEGYKIALINPGIHISTKEAYSAVVPRKPDKNLTDLLELPVIKWSGKIKNDFEDYALKKYPVIAEIKAKLTGLGAVFTLMTGSGSSVFGLFEGSVPSSLKKEFPDSLVWLEA